MSLILIHVGCTKVQHVVFFVSMTPVFIYVYTCLLYKFKQIKTLDACTDIRCICMYIVYLCKLTSNTVFKNTKIIPKITWQVLGLSSIAKLLQILTINFYNVTYFYTKIILYIHLILCISIYTFCIRKFLYNE